MKTPVLSLLLLLYISTIYSQPVSSPQIDSIARLALQAFHVPGMAVAVVKDGQVVHAKGYGVRSIRTGAPVDENTLFGIASNTKAFTAAALGILVDEGRLKWDDRVTDHIPEFVLYDPYVTREFTIRDLLTHRSGLGLGAGDLMIWPASDRQLSDIIHNLRYLKPVSSFRSKYDYDNLMYLVAGEVITRISGMPYADFIEKRIMAPLGMTGSGITCEKVKNSTNIIDAHVPVDGVLTITQKTPCSVDAAAGGIYSNLTDMCKWIIMQMNGGRYGTGLNQQLFSERVHKAMWSPVTILPVGDATDYNTHFAAYGLGWRLSDVHGYLRAGHSGGLMGMVTLVTLIPELKLGILVFTNQQSGACMQAVTGFILDSYFGIRGKDRVIQYATLERHDFEEAASVLSKVQKELEAVQKSPVPVDRKAYTGTYTDKWFGKVSVSEKEGRLWFASEASPGLTGEMIHFQANTFVVRWIDRQLDADAFASFTIDRYGKATGFTMEAISPLTDFSYDFQDLEFRRQ